MTHEHEHEHEHGNRAQFVGGPFDGRHSIRVPNRLMPPSYICTRTDGQRQHYVHTQGNGFLYAGACREVDHDGSRPHEHSCCCGKAECTEVH